MSNLDAASQQVVERQAHVLRLAKKRGHSFALIHAETDIAVSTLTSYENGTAMPLHNAVKLMRALPDDLAALLIEDSGYCLAPIEGGGESWDVVGSEAAALTHEIFEARKDRRITPREDARLKERTRQLIATAQKAVTA